MNLIVDPCWSIRDSIEIVHFVFRYYLISIFVTFFLWYLVHFGGTPWARTYKIDVWCPSRLTYHFANTSPSSHLPWNMNTCSWLRVFSCRFRLKPPLSGRIFDVWGSGFSKAAILPPCFSIINKPQISFIIVDYFASWHGSQTFLLWNDKKKKKR